MKRHEIEKRLAGDTAEDLITAGEVLASFVPSVGGAVSVILASKGEERKMRRVAEVFMDLSAELETLSSKVQAEYVSTEEFEDLFEETLRRVARERDENRRKMLSRFLLHAMLEGRHEYDDQIRLIDLIRQMSPAHVEILRGALEPPDESRYDLGVGSVTSTLGRRTELPEGLIRQVIEDLNGWNLVRFHNVVATISVIEAEKLSSQVTPLGLKLVRYLAEYKP